jgi:hypothetical protein
MFVVVPLSFLRWVRGQIVAKQRRMLQAKSFGHTQHHERVTPIVDQIKAWHAAGRTRPLRTARANWQAMSTKLASNKVDLHLVLPIHPRRKNLAGWNLISARSPFLSSANHT